MSFQIKKWGRVEILPIAIWTLRLYVLFTKRKTGD
ncbi:hypothetical protein J2782_003108 [Brucella pseudogrignonensis]|uniref:Uncharacterized protein n=1 Tax=Brucella pseudogrignonensis TaxID=419475 RepID=A0ABU1MBZ2_9HYPH|nr:hypothetical protein [Brucella pseudogrignonensis]